MHAQCLHVCPNFKQILRLPKTHIENSLGFPSSVIPLKNTSSFIHCSGASVICSVHSDKRNKHGGRDKQKGALKHKENVWSIDNEQSKAAMGPSRNPSRRPRLRNSKRRNRSGRVIVTAAMLMEIEKVLQTQEPVIKPVWNTFVSSVSGIWKGVGAVFSPFTAEMEPIGIGNQNENMYDCFTLLQIEKESPSSGGGVPQLHRKINWVVLNPFGEVPLQIKHHNGGKKGEGEEKEGVKFDNIEIKHIVPCIESFDFRGSEILEEDSMGMEPGLVFFEDGSYSRGPMSIPVGTFDESKYYLSPTFKFEQCLVKGCHKRLRIVHTIEFKDGGSDIQIVRVSVFEEQWVNPANMKDASDGELDLKPFSQRKRTAPSELAGSWKVFEVGATPISGEEGEEESTSKEGRPPFVYLCMETLKKRSLPESSAYFGEEDILDMQDVTILWLPGGVTGYVDVKKDDVLCIGVGWYSDEGINLVMERDYGSDGMLKEVRWKSEVKRRWAADPVTL
ncbi:hypothetical protein AMTRI_Chr03g146350 [Amborella trichopoda]